MGVFSRRDNQHRPREEEVGYEPGAGSPGTPPTLTLLLLAPKNRGPADRAPPLGSQPRRAMSWEGSPQPTVRCCTSCLRKSYVTGKSQPGVQVRGGGLSRMEQPGPASC